MSASREQNVAEPKVTVAIPTWNRAELLRRTMASVLSQTFTDFELVVFDNASTDDTEAVVHSFGDERVRYHRHPENLGHRANLGACLNSGTAPYVTVVLAKDAMLPRNLELKVRFLDEHPDAAFVHGGFLIMDEHDNVLTPHRRGAPPPHDFEEGSRAAVRRICEGYGSPQHVSSVLARREAVAGDGFLEEDGGPDDVALYMRMATRGSVGYLAEPLTVTRPVQGWSSTNSYLALRNGRFYTTMNAAAAGKRMRRRFIATQPLGLLDRLVLGSITRGWTRRQLISYIRQHAPHLWPPSASLPLLREALRIEPTLLLTPRAALLALSYDRVDPATADALAGEDEIAPTAVAPS
jgi:glycosyltransferase involved in cell wall biosynthesis